MTGECIVKPLTAREARFTLLANSAENREIMFHDAYWNGSESDGIARAQWLLYVRLKQFWRRKALEARHGPDDQH